MQLRLFEKLNAIKSTFKLNEESGIKKLGLHQCIKRVIESNVIPFLAAP